MNEQFPKLEVTLKTGNEAFHTGGQPHDFKLLDFWRWSASDLLNNALRGVLAEYIVAHALGVAGGVRVEWDAYDLKILSGVKVEVKSASRWQSWAQNRPSKIVFNIGPTCGWNAETNVTASERARQAHLYVFCVLDCELKTDVDPLNLGQWSFYVLPAKDLDVKLPTQKTLSLAGLQTLNPCRATFDELRSCIANLI